MENKNYTIKDIARMAGVSAGTVDRVLHNRGDVSAASLAKVRKVLDAIDYQPNVFAIGLAAKKPYRILCVLPHVEPQSYWASVAEGVERARQEIRPFNVSLDFLYYRHGDLLSYTDVCSQAIDKECDGVLIAPNFREETLRLTSRLDERSVPYVFIDFHIRLAHPLCYIGQNSEVSGYMAAKCLMVRYQPGDELVLFLNNMKDNPAEIQMQRRLEGFMRLIAERFDHLTIHDVVLDKTDNIANDDILDRFFDEHPRAVLGTVFNSRAHHVAHYLRSRQRRLNGLIGYDLLPQNCELMREGYINYLIGQRPGLQGYMGVMTLCNHLVFKRPIPAERFMPIDLLTRDNIDYYFEIE